MGRSLSIFLAREGQIKDDLLDQTRSPRETPVKVGTIRATVYTDASGVRVPEWAAFFGSAIDPQALGLESASSSAVLIVPVKNRLFAITFGQGRFLIDMLAFEPTFGLRVTLNSVPENKIRSIDKRTFEAVATHTREQAPKDASIGDFGLNVERDILRAIVGTPEDPTLGTRVHGMDSLNATVQVTLDTLPALLERYLRKSNQTTYKRRYAWIDKILEVRDPTVRSDLDRELVATLRRGGGRNVRLAIPEIIDWNDIGGFVYRGGRPAPPFPDLDLDDYLNKVRSDTLSVETLRRHRVDAVRASTGYPFARWSVYQCLYADIPRARDRYLLTNGEWYLLNRDFVTAVNNTVRAIPRTRLKPVPYIDGEDEGVYNIRLAESISGACCLDKRLISYGGGRSTIEFCDVYSPARQMVHVKRASGSSMLSHLFSQGVVAATSFISDEDFRTAANELLPPRLRIRNPASRPDPSRFELAYVIAGGPSSAISLPFFSRVTLRQAYLHLASYNFKVTLTSV